MNEAMESTSTEAVGCSTAAMVQANLKLVETVARQVARSAGTEAEYAALVSYGCEGLLDAARRFDPSRGVSFRAYASVRIRGSIIDGVRSMCPLSRRAREKFGFLSDTSGSNPAGADNAGASVGSENPAEERFRAMTTAVVVGLVAPTGHGEDGQPVAIANTEACPEAKVTQAELLALMIRAVDGLPADERELVKRHYFDGERFDNIASELGLSKSWASRLHTRALRRLAKRMGNVA